MSFSTSLSGGWKRLTLRIVKMNWALIAGTVPSCRRRPKRGSGPQPGSGGADRQDLVERLVDDEPGALPHAGQQGAAPKRAWRAHHHVGAQQRSERSERRGDGVAGDNGGRAHG